MYNSGDAAEQIVRMSLEGAEFALKITGSAAKNVAAALYTVLKDQKKTKGKARIETMLRQQRPMTIYTVKKEDCPEFARQAKSYGILYAPIPIKRATIPSIFWYSRMMQDALTELLRNSSWLRKIPPPLRARLRNPENRAAMSSLRLSKQPRKRARRISWWTKCLKSPRKRKRVNRKIHRRRKRILFPRRRKNPLRPRLPPRAAADTQRVLFDPPKKSVREELREFRRRGSRKRICPMRIKLPRRKGPRRKPPLINSRLKSGNPNQRRDDAR